MPTTRFLVQLMLALGLMATLPSQVYASTGKFMSAGVSVQGRKVERPAGYSLKLVFADSAGRYLADVAVTVKHIDGQLLGKTTAKGPWLFVKAPHGDYVVTATRHDGATLTRTVSAPRAGGMRELVFHFPEAG